MTIKCLLLLLALLPFGAMCQTNNLQLIDEAERRYYAADTALQPLRHRIKKLEKILAGKDTIYLYEVHHYSPPFYGAFIYTGNGNVIWCKVYKAKSARAQIRTYNMYLPHEAEGKEFPHRYYTWFANFDTAQMVKENREYFNYYPPSADNILVRIINGRVDIFRTVLNCDDHIDPAATDD